MSTDTTTFARSTKRYIDADCFAGQLPQNFEMGCADETLRISPRAGILDSFKSPQALLAKNLKSSNYTDLASRGVVIKQANGWEEGLVLHNKELLSARIQPVDVAKQTVEVQLRLSRGTKGKTGWFEPAISVDAKQVAFRCMIDPKSNYVKKDRLAFLREMPEWMEYDDIVKAINDNKEMKPFDRFCTDDESKGEPEGSWTAVRGFLNKFGSYEGFAILGKNTNITQESSLIYWKKKPENCLDQVHLKEITFEEVVENFKARPSPLIRFITYDNERWRFRQQDMVNFLFRIKDVDWDKPLSTDDGKHLKDEEKMSTTAPAVAVGTKKSATSTLHKISLNVDTTAFHVE